MRAIFGLILCLAITSCSFFYTEEFVGRKAEEGLTQEYAELRSQNISSLKYDLEFDLTGNRVFQGVSDIQFILKNVFPLTIDFNKGHVEEVSVNNKVVKHNYNGYYISIPDDALKLGQNQIRIKFSHEYSKNGAGLYRFEDKEDNSVYLYSHFEPYDANQLFPCFDQPDLKAIYRTKVKAPEAWQVITSVFETEKTKEGSFNFWQFPWSEKFSTYTYSLHAGDYQVWESEAKTDHQTIPLRLFARKSLASFVDPQEWFELTQKGFPFFEKFYGYPYPYKKYDQVIAPDFNFGAMENVAAVTFNEDRFVRRGEKTRSEKMSLANTLFHEMAHMWFGNLVTMKWWDDLWLNESFATYSAQRALAEATDFEDSWMTFNTFRKQSAYSADQLITTHPIVSSVPSTEEAFANFDAITYGKGASVLKQMAFFLGDEVYKKALKNYFEKHAHNNTVLADFMEEMELASKKDMENWKERWLETAMVNSLEANYTCERGRVTSFELFQSASQEYPMIRPHKTKVAFFRKSGSSIKLNKQIEVTYKTESTKVKEAIGALCPDIVYPNYQDYDYVKVVLDSKSIENIKQDLALVDDDFLRSMLWADLWQMVRDQRLSAMTFLEIVEFQGLVEANSTTLRSILDHVALTVKAYFPEDNLDWKVKKQKWVKFFESSYMTKLEEEKDVDRQKLWFDELVSLSESPELHEKLALMLKSKKEILPLQFTLDQDRRWSILAKLASYNYPGTENLLTYEKRKDSSKRGLTQALYVESLEPKKEVKEQMLRRVVNGSKKESLGNLRAIMSGLFPENQKELHREFSDRYYELLKNVVKKEDHYLSQIFTNSLVPTLCDQESSDKLQAFIKAEKLPFSVLKSLKGAAQENERCAEIKALMKASEDKKIL